MIKRYNIILQPYFPVSVVFTEVSVLKGWLTVFFSRLDCVYGVQSSMCSCLVFLKTHYFSHNLPLFHTSLSLL